MIVNDKFKFSSKLTFSEKVLFIVSNIPSGKTLSYKQVAKMAGSPLAYRAVGTLMRKNNNPKIPCHRVICSNGNLGQYNRGVEIKKALLQDEGAI